VRECHAWRRTCGRRREYASLRLSFAASRQRVRRTDFPNGEFDALRNSIHDTHFALPDDTIVLPGHGAETTIGHEKPTNPFVGEMKKEGTAASSTQTKQSSLLVR
jgi:hypothetical protein